MEKILTVGLVALQLLGCAARQDRLYMPLPQMWAEQLAGADCGRIAGEYEYYGVDADPSVVRRTSADLLVTVFNTAPQHGTQLSIVLSLEPEKRALTVQVVDPPNHAVPKVVHHLTATCENGWAVVEGTVSGQGTDAPPQTIRWRSKFTRGSDNALYVNWTYAAATKCYLIAECHDAGDGWSRFAAVSR